MGEMLRMCQSLEHETGLMGAVNKRGDVVSMCQSLEQVTVYKGAVDTSEMPGELFLNEFCM